MQDKDVKNGEADNSQNANNGPLRTLYARFQRVPKTLRIVGGALVGVVILAAVARWLPDMKERMKFFTDSSLGWLVFIVVAVQAYIYRQQAKIMSESFMVGNSSKMDVDGIDMAEINRKQKIVIKIGNIGHVAADEIKVWVDVFFQVSDKYTKPLGGARKKCQQGYFWDFGSSKLFPGKLRLKLFVPIQEHFSVRELEIAGEGQARIIVQIRIASKDEFCDWESRFAFRRDAEGTGWVIYPVRSMESLLRDLYEDEQPKYYEPK